jgi:hypothetical protein
MKRMLLIAAGLLLSACFAGCNSLPTVQQQFEAACTVVNGDLDAVAQSPFVSADQKALLNDQIIPANKAVCAAGGQLNVANLKTIHDSLLPMAITIVEAAPSLPEQQAVLLGLRAFGPLVQAQVDMLINAVSAPVAASQ